MKIRLFQIDSFTTQQFSGNPAAVCLLAYWLTDSQLLSIAAENNLSETAFIVNRHNCCELRWFTPVTEIDLCGHATLAAAYVVLNCLNRAKDIVRFRTRSGTLLVRRSGKHLSMNFPCREPRLCKAPDALIKALGKKPRRVLVSRDYMAIFDSEEDIITMRPDMDILKSLDRSGVIITARGKESDFVSRFFAPKAGIPEDPVTGSSHCTLVPYWSKQLSKSRLHALQLSKRKGELFCEYLENRVLISGQAVLYLEGSIYLRQ